jgi:SpoVK/Ycf46/Vps4 family AAA+-type ATPase
LTPPEGASSPFNPSVLLFGPKGTGKSHLLIAAAAQSKAVFFNLSPSNTAGLYQGKALVTKMLHMVFKLAKLLAPSVIYLDEAEQIFAKKGAAESKRIRKELGKYMDTILPTDRIVVVAETSKPWEADKTMQTQFSKILSTELPDYATRERIWRNKIVEHIGVERSTEIVYPLLAKFSEGYSVADVSD